MRLWGLLSGQVPDGRPVTSARRVSWLWRVHFPLPRALASPVSNTQAQITAFGREPVEK